MSRSQPEQKLCMAFTEHLGSYFPRCPGVLNYTHIANEGRSPQEGSKLKKMGVNAGWYDYIFVWKGPQIGFLEAKHGKNDLSSSQHGFTGIMRPMAVRLAVFRSVEQGHNILVDWGIEPIRPCRIFKEPSYATWEDKLNAVQNMYQP